MEQQKNPHHDFYRLQDGTQADPADVTKGKDGVMRHKNGLAVLLKENGEPQTIGQEAVDNKNVEAANAGRKPEAKPEVVAEKKAPAPEMKPAANPADAAHRAPEPAKAV